MIKYFKTSIIVSIIGLVMAFLVGEYYYGNASGGMNALFLSAVLAILEISLSFDNAVVNAIVLKKMTPLWRHRFLTWGMLIAVFGMRLVFPLLIVSFIAKINPWASLVMATFHPADYASTMLSAHVSISSFGGIFLLMVALKYFVDINKETHWIGFLEGPLSQLGKLEAIEVAISLIVILLLSKILPESDQIPFIFSGCVGLVVFLIVDAIGSLLEQMGIESGDAHKASLGMFLYLEVLDSSFSFDGVIGAFAITNNLFLILIGLSIGAFFVRSLTIMFVEHNTLDGFKFLEHGAFYAIGVLSLSMLVSSFLHIPEWIIGLSGAVIIGISVLSSLKEKNQTNGANSNN